MHFVFKLKHLQPLIDHTCAAKEHWCPYGTDTSKPGLILVKDQGAYLLSNGRPDLMSPDGRMRLVVYAKGCRPEDGHIGGDDFAELIEIKFFTDALKHRLLEVGITLTDSKMTLEAR